MHLLDDKDAAHGSEDLTEIAQAVFVFGNARRLLGRRKKLKIVSPEGDVLILELQLSGGDHT